SSGNRLESATLILAYLNEKNRPYSAQDVFCNLQKQHGLGKTAVVKAMELLALEGKIKEKTYGKQKIYFADQVGFLFREFSHFTFTCDVCLNRAEGAEQFPHNRRNGRRDPAAEKRMLWV
uniref:Homologous-pairing protein 2 homolog n=1 Tax=Oryzias sinensis TaxID=183150 RepID=A0A8C7XAR5_9TELE